MEEFDIKSAPLEKMLKSISKLYSLDKNEYEIIKYFILKTTTPLIFDLFANVNGEFSEIEIFGMGYLNLKTWASNQILNQLKQKGLFQKSHMNINNSFTLNQKIIRIFGDPNINTTTKIKNILLGENQKSNLLWADFDYIENERKITKNILTSAIKNKSRGINILLFGDVGTGKTQFAKLIANKSKIDMYAVTAECTEKEATRRDRLSDLASKQEILSRTKNSCILFDEAEYVMNRGFNEGGRGFKSLFEQLN